MIMNLCYYLVSTSLIATAFFSTYYYYDENGAKNLIINISWKSTNVYFLTKSYIDKFLYKPVDTVQTVDKVETVDQVQNEPKKNYIVFDSKKNEYSNIDNLNVLNNLEFDSSLVFLKEFNKKGDKFKRITKDRSNLEFIQIPKQFIQVELIVGTIELDIHQYLKEYYYKKNIILDTTFLLWLCKYNSLNEIPLKDIREGNYTIKIIDKNVEMFDLTSKQSIEFGEDSGYIINNIK